MTTQQIVSLEEFFLDLYNGYSGIAERASDENRDRIHVKTPLESKIVEWLLKGRDVILTGSPGDGKTHLLQQVKVNLEQHEIKLQTEQDASQKTEPEILSEWKRARDGKVPFLLAINHAPLRKLAKAAGNEPEFKAFYDAILSELKTSEIVNFVIYSQEQRDEFEKGQQTYIRQGIKPNALMIVNLTHRATLTDKEGFVLPLVEKLVDIASNMTCVESDLPPDCTRCPIKYNVKALLNKSVQQHFLAILELVARRGYRATVRDLIALIVYMLTRGVHCKELWREERDFSDNSYYNLAYDPDAQGELFEAIRETFDPGDFADPAVDLDLWNGSRVNAMWIDEEPVGQPRDLNDLRYLKRRYFFESNEKSEDLFARILSKTESEFNALFDERRDTREKVEDLVKKINLFYAPRANDHDYSYRSQLRLWNSHRYSVGSVPGYFALRFYSAENLDLYQPSLNPKYENALQIHQDHVLLGTRFWLPGDPSLRVDWEVFRALASAENGTPIDVQPYHILRRLDLFLRQLGLLVSNYAPIETIEWSDHARRDVVRLRINRNERQYEKGV